MTNPPTADELRVNIAGVELRNPVLLASGTAGYIDEMAGALDLTDVGAVVTKSITREPRAGNETWRVVEVAGGMLNAIGLANVGMEQFANEYGPKIETAPTTIFGSIAGYCIEDYVAVVEMFDRLGAIPAVEVNVSCPNVHDGSMFGESSALLGELVSAIRPALSQTKLIVKLPPVTTGAGRDHGIVSLAQAAIEAGADALTIANTTPAMAIDVQSRKPKLANVTGGLSGPAVHPIAVRLVHQVYQGVARDAGVPIIAAGGVLNWRDAAEFILVGASAIEIGTGLFVDPRIPRRVVIGLKKWVRKQGCSSVSELVGAVRLDGT